MELGEYYKKNQDRIASLRDCDWRVSLDKCKKHIQLRLWQKKLTGAHSASRLGADPIEHYLGISYEKILTGEWEWKDKYSLTEQMIRIADSYISTEVEKKKTKKEESLEIKYKDVEQVFYDLTDPPDTSEEEAVYAERLQLIENAIKGDAQLELFMEAVREGMKRADIAEILEIQPRQLDKVRDKLMRRVKNYKSS
jgi:DNA-directed RNA polymerase specialized sigma24 family protein